MGFCRGGHSEDVQEEMSELGCQFGPAFRYVYGQIPSEAHRQVQLTFEYGELPTRVVAEKFPGHPFFNTRLASGTDGVGKGT